MSPGNDADAAPDTAPDTAPEPAPDTAPDAARAEGGLDDLTTAPTAKTQRARFQVYVSADQCFWRLLGGNNRGYGRSFEVSLSLEATRDSAAAAAMAAHEGTFELMSAGGRDWSWILVHDGAPIARSDGVYGRRVECLASVGRFKAMAPSAPITFVRFIPRDRTAPSGVGLSVVRRSPRRGRSVHPSLGG